MKAYQFFAVLIVNKKITEEPEFHPREPVIKYQAREDFGFKKAPKVSLVTRDKIKNERNILWHQVNN